MNFLSPAWFYLGLLAVPILLLYLLKLRRREVRVSSVFLWSALLRDRQANTPWQRMKRNLLLLLQLILLLSIVLALARPALPAPGLASSSVIILLDASASMNATDVRPSRFEAGKDAARQLVTGLKDDARATLILAGSSPQVLASGERDKSRLQRALEKARPENGKPDWEAAFAIAAGAASAALNAGSSDFTTVIISDGGLPEGLPPLPGEVRYIPVGQAANNLGISAMALRPAPGGPQLFVQVQNYGDAPAQAVLSFYASGKLFDARQVDIGAGEYIDTILTELPENQAIFRASLSSLSGSPLDNFSLDDNAFAVYTPSNAGRALLVSKGNFFLEQLLAALSGVTPYKALADESGDFQMPSEAFNLYIFDGVFPSELPEGNLLLVNPPGNPLFQVGESYTPTNEASVAEDPLTRFVNWKPVHISQAKSIEAPSWAKVLITSGSHPLVFTGEVGGRRVAVVAFDLHDSDLPLQVAYPILFSNLIDYLLPKGPFDASADLSPGDSLRISPVPGSTSVVVTSPGGSTYDPSPGEDGALFTNTGELGVYEVRYSNGGSAPPESGQQTGYFAVNLFQPAESDLHPASSIQVGRAVISPSEEKATGQRELWPWLALLALLLLLVEWSVYQQRGQLSGIWKRLIFWRPDRSAAGPR